MGRTKSKYEGMTAEEKDKAKKEKKNSQERERRKLQKLAKGLSPLGGKKNGEIGAGERASGGGGGGGGGGVEAEAKKRKVGAESEAPPTSVPPPPPSQQQQQQQQQQVADQFVTFTVTVPAHLKPGDFFKAMVQGTKVKLAVPPNLGDRRMMRGRMKKPAATPPESEPPAKKVKENESGNV